MKNFVLKCIEAYNPFGIGSLNDIIIEHFTSVKY